MLGGLPIIYGISPLKYEVAPSHPLGSIGYTPDGRKFRYAKNNATNAMVAGTLQQASVEDTAVESIVVAAAAIGDMTVTTTGTVTVTANQYSNGYIVATGEASTGNGYYYRIKSHPAATAAVVTFTLYDPIQVAFTATTQIDIVPNPYSGVIINPTSATSAPVGVAMNVCPASYYTWIQTGGVGIVYADASGAVTVGAAVTASNQTAGCVEDGDSYTLAPIGVALTGIAQAEFGLANLRID